ncbi:hypothetical protein AKO1_014220, partial [Acrasis kona]
MRMNALKVIHQVFTSHPNILTDQPRLSSILADQLLLRLDDSELHIRTHASDLFAHVDPNKIVPKLIKLELHKSERIRSAAHIALKNCLCHQNRTQSSDCWLITMDAIRDIFNVTHSESPAITSPADIIKVVPSSVPSADVNVEQCKQVAQRIFEAIMPSVAEKLSLSACWEIIKGITNKVIASPSDSLLIYMMSQSFGVLLVVRDRFEESTIDEYVKNLIKIVLDGLERDLVVCANELNESNVNVRNDLLFARLGYMLLLKGIPVSSILKLLKSDHELAEHLSNVLLKRMQDQQEFDEIRKISADLYARLPRAQIIVNLLKDSVQQGSFQIAKVYLFSLLNFITYQSSTGDMDPYYNEYLSILMQIIKLPSHQGSQDLIKLQQGSIDCMTLTMNFKYDDTNMFLIKLIQDETPSSFLISLIHVVTKSFDVIKLSNTLLLSEKIVTVFDDLLKKYNHHVLWSAVMQCLLHMVYRIKTAVHPYTKVILRIICDGLSIDSDQVKLASLKLLSGVLVSREDVIMDFESIFEQILRRVEGLSQIDKSETVRS